MLPIFNPETTCCFFGHREIAETETLRQQLSLRIEQLIAKQHVDTFLFGSKSRFNTLCYELVTHLKDKHPHIKRIYVRAEFPEMDDDYLAYLLEHYEDTYYPKAAQHAGKAVYIERNRNMIDHSRFCIVYCQEDRLPTGRKSGTKLALEYALYKHKAIFIFP